MTFTKIAADWRHFLTNFIAIFAFVFMHSARNHIGPSFQRSFLLVATRTSIAATCVTWRRIGFERLSSVCTIIPTISGNELAAIVFAIDLCLTVLVGGFFELFLELGPMVCVSWIINGRFRLLLDLLSIGNERGRAGAAWTGVIMVCVVPDRLMMVVNRLYQKSV